MRVLFVTWECYPYKTATSNCVRAIIDVLKKNHIDVGLLSVTGNFGLDECINDDGVKIYNIFCEIFSPVKGLIRRKKYSAFFKAVIYKLLNKLSFIQNDKVVIKRLMKALQSYAEDYDILVPVSSTYLTAYACMDYCKEYSKKFFLYQVDPIASNMAYHNQKRMKEIDRKIFDAAECVFTTPIIAREKEDDSHYDCSKIIPVEFPNVRDLTGQMDRRLENTSEIVCFYSGRFYSGVRECDFVLNILSHVKLENLKIVFAGSGQEDIIDEYRKGALLGKLEHIGEVTLDESFRIMQQADILINIGNNVANQVPSKLFDYISTGKPILNFCKLNDCPTISYLKKYGNALSIIEGVQSIEAQAKEVEEFIAGRLGRNLEYGDIKNLFFENTAEYVGQKFVNVIRDLLR